MRVYEIGNVLLVLQTQVLTQIMCVGLVSIDEQ